MGQRYRGGCRWIMLEPDVCPACADIAAWRAQKAKACRVTDVDQVMAAGDARHKGHVRTGLIPLPYGAMIVA